METSIVNQNFSADNPSWVLLAELSLEDFLSDPKLGEELTSGYLFQTVQELGVSAECIENIAEMLAGLDKEASVHTKKEKPGFSRQMRIFCQKKIVDDAKLARTSRPSHTEQPKKQKQDFPDSKANTIGGWGYFMIERAEDPAPGSSAIPHNSIDLYLYKEGE
jgi:hypothetical protein